MFQIEGPAAEGGGGEAQLDYVEFTSDVTVNTHSAAAAVAVVTGNAVAYDGATRISVEFYSPSGAIGTDLIVLLVEDGTSIGQLAYSSGPAQNKTETIHARRFLTPSAGTHTYAIKAYTSSLDGLIRGGAGGAGAFMPGYIRITEA